VNRTDTLSDHRLARAGLPDRDYREDGRHGEPVKSWLIVATSGHDSSKVDAMKAKEDVTGWAPLGKGPSWDLRRPPPADHGETVLAAKGVRPITGAGRIVGAAHSI